MVTTLAARGAGDRGAGLGWMLTGGFCGRRGNGGGDSNPNRRSYYRLWFSAVFDHDFTATGGWTDSTLFPGATTATGGEGYLTGADRAGRGSGGWVSFDTSANPNVRMRIGISYVEAAGAVVSDDSLKLYTERVGAD